MEKNFDGFSIGGQDDKFRNAAVQGLGSCGIAMRRLTSTDWEKTHTFVGTLLQLLVLRRLLH